MEAPQVTQAPARQKEPRVINYGGVRFAVPDDWGDDQINDALNNYRQTPQFDASIDKRTGAPKEVRLKVNLAPAQDRLTELKKTYPDAIPYGDDNFVYTDPSTGRLTLFDETKGGLFGSGFTFNDVYDVAREGAQFAGGVAGAWVGGIPGAAAGAAAADVATNLIAEKVLGVEDTRTFGEAAIDTATSAVFAAAGEGVGKYAFPWVGKSVRRVLGADEKSKAIYDAMKAAEITPTAGAVTRGRGAGIVEAGLSAAPTAKTTMQKQVDTVLSETEKAVKKLARKFGAAKSQQEAGIGIQTAVGAAQKRYHAKVAKLEGGLAEKIGDDTLFDLKNLRELRRSWAQKIADDPNAFSADMKATISDKYKSALEIIDGILADAQSGYGALPYRLFRDYRTDFRVVSEAFETDALQRPLYSEMYRAMTADLKAGVDRVGGSALRKEWDEVMKFQAEWKSTNQAIFDKIAKYDAPERAYRFLMNERQDGGTILSRLRNEFTEEEWSDVSATVLQKMGYRRLGNELDTKFSVETFLTNYGNVADEAKDAFFGSKGSPLRNALDNLKETMADMAESARLRNFSNTAQAAEFLNSMAALGMDISNIGVSAITGQPKGLMAGGASLAGNVLGRLLMPNQIAKLMTSPRFVKWLATPSRKTSEIGGRIGQLVAIANYEPEIAQEIKAFAAAIGSLDGE